MPRAAVPDTHSSTSVAGVDEPDKLTVTVLYTLPESPSSAVAGETATDSTCAAAASAIVIAPNRSCTGCTPSDTPVAVTAPAPASTVSPPDSVTPSGTADSRSVTTRGALAPASVTDGVPELAFKLAHTAPSVTQDKT